MPGVDLNLNLPNDGDPVATYNPALKAAIQALQADIEPKIVWSEVDPNQDLDLGGFDLTGVGHVVMEPSADATGASGTAIFYNGDWYLATDSGVVRITEGGAISGTGQRGFVGDYGVGGNPAAATYVDTDGSFVFTEQPGTYADLECDDLVLHGSLAAWRLSLSNTAAVNKTLTLDASIVPAAAGNAILLCDDTGLVKSTETGNLVTKAFGIDGVDVTLSGGAEINHGQRWRVFAPRPYANNAAGTQNFIPTTGGVVGNTAAVPYVYDLDNWVVGDRVASLVFAKKGAVATDDITTIAVVLVKPDGTETTLNPSPSSQNDIGNTWTTTTVDFDDTTLALGEYIRLRLTPAQANMSFGSCRVSYTHV